MRITKDEYYIKIAEAVAVRSTCLKHKYGAVIVSGDAIIATGYNGAPRGEPNCCDVGECHAEARSRPVDDKAAMHGGQYGSCAAVHAEQNALISASSKELKGAKLYLACLSGKREIGSCNICDRMIKNAGILKVVTKEDVCKA